VAHNLVIVKIKKSYSGQGMKVINSLLGAGQMMFTKYIVVVDGNVDIRDYNNLLKRVFANTDFERDLLFIRGPIDVLDHSSDTFAFGGKLGIDATLKTPEEKQSESGKHDSVTDDHHNFFKSLVIENIVVGFNTDFLKTGIPLVIVSVNLSADSMAIDKLKKRLDLLSDGRRFLICIIVDHTVDVSDIFTVAWQALGNSDPVRDQYHNPNKYILLDATIKAFRSGGFTRRWPNVVCSGPGTIKKIDDKWDLLGIAYFIPSPSRKRFILMREGNEEVKI